MNMHVWCEISAAAVIVRWVMMVLLIARMIMRTAHLNRHQIHLPVTHATLCN